MVIWLKRVANVKEGARLAWGGLDCANQCNQPTNGMSLAYARCRPAPSLSVKALICIR